MNRSLRVLLLEPYFTGSHQVWAEGWCRHSRHQLHLLTQPGTHWRHRMMAASVPLARATTELVRAEGRPDVVVASDMVDLAGYLGLCRGVLAGVPAVVYFHENQLTQPVSPNGMGGLRDRHLAWTNWRSLLAADEVWFNSNWQRDSLRDGLEDLLVGGAAGDDQTALLDEAEVRWRVHPVGCDLGDLLAAPRRGAAGGGSGGAPLVVWNHRWGHDKGLDLAARSLQTLAEEGVAFSVAVVGGGDDDDAVDNAHMDRMVEPFADRVVVRGRLPEREYRDLLVRADVVVASARQENFGIAVVEAVAAGCVPVVPDALAYPETITEADLRYPPGRLTTRLREVLCDLDTWRERTIPTRDALARYDWPVVARHDDDALEALVGAADGVVSGGTR